MAVPNRQMPALPMKGKPENLPGIEAGRGIASLLVVFYHVSRHLVKADEKSLTEVFQFGHAGVDFFFVISGFIILYVHYDDIGRASHVCRYFGRRMSRLLPAYWLALALTTILKLVGGHDAPSVSDLIWSASLLPSNHGLILELAWTLRFEVLFYVVFAILIINRAAGLIVLGVWLAATIAALVTSFHVGWLPDQFYNGYNLEFFLGLTVAYVLRNYTVLNSRAVLALGLLLFSATALLEDAKILNGYDTTARPVYGIASAVVVLGAAEASRQRLLHVPAMLRSIGAASYSIYLFQFIFIGALWQAMVAARLPDQIPLILSFLALASAAVAGGVLTSTWIERPLLRLLRRPRLRNTGTRSGVNDTALLHQPD